MERMGSRVTVSDEKEFKRYVKTARGFDKEQRLLNREFQAMQAAAEIRDEAGNPVALPSTRILDNQITMETPHGYSSPIKDFFDRDLPTDWRGQVSLIGKKLAVLHRASIDFGAEPESPILYPIPAHLFMHITDGALWTLKQLPKQVHETLKRTITQLQEMESVFIHGDLSIDNVLTTEHDAVFIDWELAGAGPNLHDISSLMASFLASRVRAQTARGTVRTSVPAGLMGEFKEFTAHLLGAYGFASDTDEAVLLVRVVALKLLARSQVVAAASVPQTALATVLLRMTINMTANATAISKGLMRDAK
ncbi:aminoglycoside phosphotransferase family protein [Auritidibacter ignavus]|uniref:aminoglycoside phosphotransferase family protein n=1 Tax=Auritidibacter ignavus TaxID=678932 RepID=UPI00109CD351|nr:aminoglycoside phosphotransferase family protein [Auritidibacter ignavus]